MSSNAVDIVLQLIHIDKGMTELLTQAYDLQKLFKICLRDYKTNLMNEVEIKSLKIGERLATTTNIIPSEINEKGKNPILTECLKSVEMNMNCHSSDEVSKESQNKEFKVEYVDDSVVVPAKRSFFRRSAEEKLQIKNKQKEKLIKKKQRMIQHLKDAQHKLTKETKILSTMKYEADMFQLKTKKEVKEEENVPRERKESGNER